MRVWLCLLVLAFATVGCSSNPPTITPEAAVQSIHSGMSEHEVRAVLKGIALDSGVSNSGGTGARRVYFELPESRQVWVEFAGAAGDWKVVEVGRIEPKKRWVRYNGEEISIE